jgi:PKD repeat protein
LLPSEGEPATIQVVHGDGQSARVGKALANPIIVQVTNGRGQPVEGATVAFQLTSSGPNSEITPDTATTDANGEASAEIVLGTTTGLQRGEARLVSGDGGVPQSASFTAIARPENANGMAAVGGDDQTGRVNAPLDQPLVVQVTDAFGNPISGVPISWEAEGGGTVSAETVNTDDEGKASVQRILGPATGVQTTVARSEGLAGSPVTFIHSALAGDASRLALVSGDNQTGQVGTQLPAELVVRVIDGEGNGVPNTAVAWLVATGGGSVIPTNSNTDQDGRASARWTVGGSPGPNRLDAVVSGVGVVSFDATATSAPPAVLAIVTQPSATAQNGVPFARQPVIQLRDAAGHPVGSAGIAISAAIGAGSGALTGTRQQVTDGSGRASFTDLAISGADGQHTLVFSSTGYASVTSNGVTVGAISTSTTITNDTPDPSVAGSSVTVEFRVASAGPTPTGSVTVTALDGGATCSGELSGGAGSCQMTMNIVGDRTLRAEYSGAPGFNSSSDTEGHRVDASQPENREPDADFNWHCEDLTCQFIDRSSDPNGDQTITSIHWDFGDGATADNERNLSHTYAVAGKYRVVLRVTDTGGLSDESEDQVDPSAPENRKPHAEFSVACPNADLTCTFTDASRDDDGSVTAWHWDFGDGQSFDGQSPPPHVYGAAQTYQVTLTVTDNGGAQDSKTHDAHPQAPPENRGPKAEFEVSCANQDLTCTFTDASRDDDGSVTAWHWEFGDGQGFDGQSPPPHTYGAAQAYQVTLTVTDNGGAQDSKTHDAHPQAPPENHAPNAEFEVSCANQDLTCTFTDASRDDDGSVTGWHWDFGDGQSFDGQSPTPHTYGAAQTYQVTLTVTDNGGAQDSKTRDANPQALAPPPQDGQLGFRSPPPDRSTSGDRLRPAPEVQLLDGSGNDLKLERVNVSARIGSGGGSLGGRTSRSTNRDGRARFDDLSILAPVGSQVTLVFQAQGFAQLSSSPILVE